MGPCPDSRNHLDQPAFESDSLLAIVLFALPRSHANGTALPHLLNLRRHLRDSKTILNYQPVAFSQTEPAFLPRNQNGTVLVCMISATVQEIECREILLASVEYEMHRLVATRLHRIRQSPSPSSNRSFVAQIGGDRVLDPGIVARRRFPDRHAVRHPCTGMEESSTRFPR